MTVLQEEPWGPRRRIRVWFGEHVIVDHVTGAAIAAHYEHAMRRRFAGLRVTNEEVPQCRVRE